MADELLHANEWVSLRKVVAPDLGISGYVYSHETRCGGRIVAVLPFRITPAGLQVMVKCEVTPCWSVDEPIPSALTGGWEGGDPAEDAVRELWEEAGYEATTDELLRLGSCRGTKSTDTVYDLYAVDVTRKVQQEAPGDGTRLESEAETRWLDDDDVNIISDPVVALVYLRLRAGLRRLLDVAYGPDRGGRRG